MRVARFYEPGDLRVEDAPKPEPGPGELLIRVRACGTCGTDAKIYNYGHHHIDPPRVIGHEIAGEVSSLGAGTSGWTPGDRVQVIAAVPCGECIECTTTAMTVCSRLKSIGYHWDGGFAEWMVVPEAVLNVDGLSRIPDDLSFAEAAVTEPLACVLNGQELAGVGGGDVVVVTGAGPIGCLHVRLARARGAASVYLIDINAERAEQAAALVAPDEVIDASSVDAVDTVRKLTDGRGADVIITAAAAGQAQVEALEMAAPRGRVSLFGGLPKDKPTIAFNSNTVHYRELTVVGAAGSTPRHNAEALALIASGDVGVHDLITDRMPLEDVTDAIKRVMSGDAIKVVIQP